MRAFPAFVAVVLASSLALAAGCGTTVSPSDFASADGGARGGKGSGGGAGGGGSSGDPGGGGGIFGGDGGTAALGDAACVTDVHKSQASALDLYIMQDQSGSMNDVGKWTSIQSAFQSFVQSPQASGIGVGIQYFPLAAGDSATCAAKCTDCTCVALCGCTGCQCNNNACSCLAAGSSCSAADYAKPDVEIAALPGAASAITASLANHTPNGGTPSHPALDGAIQHAKDYATAHAGHKVVVVLATDGEPNDCNSTVDNVAPLAAAGVAGSPSILTFVIGVGGDLAGLNPVAASGGTQQAFLVDTNQNVTTQFLDALNKIRALSISCEYSIPAPSSGSIDYSKVNVVYTSNGQQNVVGQVSGKSACDATAGGWYYDDPSHPTKIEICDASCKAFNAGNVSVGGEVDVAFGCDTVKQTPK